MLELIDTRRLEARAQAPASNALYLRLGLEDLDTTAGITRPNHDVDQGPLELGDLEHLPQRSLEGTNLKMICVLAVQQQDAYLLFFDEILGVPPWPKEDEG